MKADPKELYRGMSPLFIDFHECCFNLKFKQEPDYDTWINKFCREYIRVKNRPAGQSFTFK